MEWAAVRCRAPSSCIALRRFLKSLFFRLVMKLPYDSRRTCAKYSCTSSTELISRARSNCPTYESCSLPVLDGVAEVGRRRIVDVRRFHLRREPVLGANCRRTSQ